MELSNIFKELFINSIYLINFLVFTLIAFYLFRFFLNLKDNKEENIINGFLIFALSISVSSLYTGESYGLLNDLIYIWIYSFLSFFLLLIGHFITDFIVFHKVKNIQKIKEGNLSLLIVEIAHFISIGIVINTLIDNYFSPNISHITLFFNILGIFFIIQFLLLLSILIYVKLLNILKGIDVINLIYKNNLSSGIFLFSNYIVISFLLVSAFSPEKNLIITLVYSLIYFVFSTFLILIFKLLIDFILIPKDNIKNIIEKDNYYKAIFIEVITISMIFIYHFISS